MTKRSEPEWRQWVRRWKASPLDFVLEALFKIDAESWEPWEPGTPKNPDDYVGPEKWQGEFLQDVGAALTEGKRRFCVRAGHGVGKALSYSSPILGPNGWYPIGEARVGDRVATVDGSFTRITGVFPQGKRQIYRVTLDDGCHVDVDGDHLWETTNRSERKHGKVGKVRTTREIMESLTFPNGERKGLNHCLPRLQAVQHPRAVFAVDPYVLGVWLGDGSAEGRISTNALDEDIVAACGHGVVRVRNGGVSFAPPGIARGLKAIGLLGCRSWERHVPRNYLHGSIEQRTALLQGLLDTDGTVGKNNAVTFDTSSKPLAEGVSELVRSLGGVARSGARQGKLNGEHKRWSYRVYVALPEDVAPFRCVRKANSYKPSHSHQNRSRTLQRFIKSVEPIGNDEAVCITVDHPSKLFVTRDHIVTHNSTVEAWLILWFLLFMRPCKVPVTANSQDQLRDVVWAEVSRWYRELPPFLQTMLEISTERVVVKADPTEAFAVARTARPEKPEALQGFHSENLLFMIEEASGIDDVIFETAGGALSSDHSWVFMFGNPTRTSGYFYRAFHEARETWRCYHVPCTQSSRVSDAYGPNVAIEHGEDSNVYRVRVLGDFPLSEDDAVIPLGWIEAAMVRDIGPSEAGLVWGLDVARFGDDSTALAKRRGNTLLEPVREWRKQDLMQTAGLIAKEYRETPLNLRPTAINVDVIGMGGGVVDRLRELGLPVRGINVAEAPGIDRDKYMRLRDELWFEARKWFESKAVVMPQDDKLAAELVGPKYKLESSGKLKVESKDDMKKRGVKSPNKADAFCLTFAGGDEAHISNRRTTAIMDYDPFKVGSQEFEQELRQTIAGQEYSPF